MKKVSKILYAICILIIIIGFIVFKTKGTNYSLEYAKGKNIEIYFESAIEKDEIKEISKEVFGNNIKVNEIERFKDAFSIVVDENITDEQKNTFISKINEKYGLEKTVEDLTIIDVPKVQGKDLIRNYIMPTGISILVIFIYLTIRYRKIGNIKTALCTIIKAIIITGAYFGAVVIIRIPVVNMYTIPVGILVSITALIAICYENEKSIDKLYEENKIEKNK